MQTILLRFMSSFGTTQELAAQITRQCVHTVLQPSNTCSAIQLSLRSGLLCDYNIGHWGLFGFS